MNLITAYNEHCCGHDWPSQTTVATPCYIGTVHVANALFARSRLARILAKATLTLLTGYSVLDSTDDLMIKVTSYQAMAPSWRRVLFMILTRLPSNENYWEFLWGRSKSENFLWICCLHLAGMYCLPICVHVTTHFIFYEQSFYSFHAILIYLVSNLVNADYKQQISRCQRYAIMH